MTGRHTVRALVAGTSTVLVLTACSTVDNASSCAEMLEALTQGAESIAGAASDPTTAEAEAREFATNLRDAAEGADEEVRAAAGELAELYEEMAADIQAGQAPDLSRLEAAGGTLRDACT